MNKSDYDKYYKKGGTYVIPTELFNELFDELERQTSNYEQALEDLDKQDKELEARKQLINKQDKELWTLEHIIKEVRENLDKQITFCTNEADGTTNDKICRITINYLKHLKETLEKEVN